MKKAIVVFASLVVSVTIAHADVTKKLPIQRTPYDSLMRMFEILDPRATKWFVEPGTGQRSLIKVGTGDKAGTFVFVIGGDKSLSLRCAAPSIKDAKRLCDTVEKQYLHTQ